MPGPEMDLKRELYEAGNRLMKPPASVDDLLALLDRVEHCLSFVEQQPPVEMQDALCPAFKALISNELLKHADVDVRVGVAACLTEISRITAPDVPYGDQFMKEVFRLTISAFEGLWDKSSKSFGKRISILETVARVRSCAVLLDLDCDSLVVEMFQNFYKCIRDFHTENVFTSMESIMTLVIEEYDAISTDLLFALLSVLKRENQDASPAAKRLGEKVVQTCAEKLKSCIVEAVKSLKIDLLDYDFVVTLACQTAPTHDSNGEVTPDVPLVNGVDSLVKTVEKEAAFQASPSSTPLIPPISNILIVEEDKDNATPQGLLNTAHELGSTVIGCTSKTIQDHVQVGPGPVRVTNDIATNPDSVSLPKSELKSDKIAKKRGRKPKNAKDIMDTVSSKVPQPDDNKQASESLVSETNFSMEVLGAHHHDSQKDLSVPEKNCDSSNQLSPKVMENNVVNLGSQSQTDIPPLKSSSEIIRQSEEPILVEDATSSHQNSVKRPSDVLIDPETLHLSLEKVVPGVVGDTSNIVTSIEVKNEQDIEGDSQLGITGGAIRSKKRGRPRKDASMTAVTGAKGGVSAEDTSQKRSRLMFTYPEEGKEYKEDLIGTRIKVWWPADREYYEGIVKSYDPIKRTHKILYTDNESERLRLCKQKWKLLKSSIGSKKDQMTSHTVAGDDASDKQEGGKMKADSSSAGTIGNTDSPPKRRRGRPPKNYAAMASYESPVKGNMLEFQTKPKEDQNDSALADENPVKSMDSMVQCKDAPMNSGNIRHDVLLQNGGTQTKQEASMDTGVTDTAIPKPAVRLDINDPFTYRSDDEPDPSETVTLKTGNSNVRTEEVPRVAGLNLAFPAFGTGTGSRKRKPRTICNSNSPAIAGSSDTPTKKRRGRPPYKFLLQNSIEESKDLRQLSGPNLDQSRRMDPFNNVVVDKSKGSLEVSRNAHYMSAEHNLNLNSTPDSLRTGTKEDVAAAQTSSKSATGELKLGSPTGLKIKFKTSVPEPMIRRRRSSKTISSPSDRSNIDGSVKRLQDRSTSRVKNASLKQYFTGEGNVIPGAVSQHRAEDTEPDYENINKAGNSGNSSDLIPKNDTPSINFQKDPVPADVSIKNKENTTEVGDNINNISSDIGNNSLAEARIGS